MTSHTRSVAPLSAALLLLLCVIAGACSASSTTGTAVQVDGAAPSVVATDADTTAPAGVEDVEEAEDVEHVEHVEEAATDGGAGSTARDHACPDMDFMLEVNDIERSDGYPDPELAVTCTDEAFVVETNDIIGYEFVAMTPNDLEAQDFSFTITLDPVEADTPGSLKLGPIGVAINGVTIFGAFEAPQDGYQDPLLDGLLDFCNGHTAPGGLYHYHARFDCIIDDPTEAEAVIGYLFDGYEIVTPYACVDASCTGSYEVTSSYVRTDPDGLGAFDAWEYVEGAGELVECNGMIGADGVYRYYVTDAFPYVPFCYHGETSYAGGDFTGAEPAGAGRP